MILKKFYPYISLLLISLFVLISSFSIINKPQTDTTKFILVRHAETSGNDSQRALNSVGIERANNLKNLYAHQNISAIYSTKYNRTIQTAQPLAQSLNQAIQNYSPRELKTFAEKLLVTHKGETVLIMGHSNTTPHLANYLIKEERFSDLPETEFGKIFVVTINGNEEANVEIKRY